MLRRKINMTRFQIAVIKDGVIYTSAEFNGDGYWDGHGKNVYAALQNIATVEEWKEYVTKFNSETFQYDEELHYEIEDEYDDYLDMSKDYYEKWFSDYIYIKNIGEGEVEFVTGNGKAMLEPDDVGVFNFGTRLIPGTGDEYECVKEPLMLNAKLLDKLGANGWHISDCSDNTFYFSKYSPAGQDFGFEVEGDDVEEIADEIYKYYDDFDPSYEAYLWLDETGHGRNGAPYNMKDLYEDMEACQDMILELHDIIEEEM